MYYWTVNGMDILKFKYLNIKLPYIVLWLRKWENFLKVLKN